MTIRKAAEHAAIVVDFDIASGERVRRVIDINIQTRQHFAEVKVVTPPSAAPYLRQQSNPFGGAAATGLVILPVVPTEGNLLMAAVDTSGGSLVGTSFSTTGWTAVGTVTSSPGQTTLWTKTASSDEPRDLTIAVSGATYLNTTMFEFGNVVSGAVDGSSSAFTTTGTQVFSTGTTDTTTQENVLAIALWGSGASNAGDAPELTNGFEEITTIPNRSLVVAINVPAAIGMFESTASFSKKHGLRSLMVVLRAPTTTGVAAERSQEARRFVEFQRPLLAAPSLPDLPDAPTGLAVTTIGTGLGVSWLGAQRATGYNLYQNGSVIWSRSNVHVPGAALDEVGAVRGTFLKNVPLGAYQFAVSATNRAGESELSELLTVAPSESLTPRAFVIDDVGMEVALEPWIANEDGTYSRVDLAVVQ